jgi:hypothetical protein
MRWKPIVIALMVNSVAALQVAEAPRWQLAQIIFGQRCQTAQGWCFMAAPAPVGTQCFCPTPFGPAGGFVVQ